MMTIHVAYKGWAIRIFGAGYWRKGKKTYEKHKVKYTKGPIGKIKIKATISAARESTL
jgi:hypothetical protein